MYGADLLEFARGPAIQGSLIILVAGILWRLTGILFLPRKADHSQPREAIAARISGGLGNIVKRSWPYAPFAKRVGYSDTISYTFHIGLAIVVFFYQPHILFIKSITGLSWPALPNSVIYVSGVVTLAALIAMIVRRMSHPVLRLLSNFDDYFSWFVTTAPIITGLMAVAHFGGRYETLLAIHILSIALLFIWLPFGKLMHTFLFAISRATEGAAFARKGAKS